jgi:hypothetical protein
MRWLGWLLLALAVLATAGVAGFLGYLIDLWASGYSGGGNPADISTLSLPLALLFFLIFEIPALTVAAAFWLAYRAVRARSRAVLSGRAQGGRPVTPPA